MIRHALHTSTAMVLAIALVALALVLGMVLVEGRARHTVPDAPFPKPFALSARAIRASAALVYDPANGRTLFAKDPATALAASPLLALPVTLGTYNAASSTTVVFDADIGHPLVLVLVSTSTATRAADIRTIMQAAHPAH